MNWYIIDNIIINALNEDMPYGDITTDNIFSSNAISSAKLLAKEDGIIAGLEVFKRVFQLVDNNTVIDIKVNDGDTVTNKQLLANISGKTISLLKAERVALNLLQRMSGIATITNLFVDKVKPYNCRIVDTRKTLPNLRILDKLAVKIGGGHNHRFNLSDAVMIKDNHIQAAGSITNAVELVRNNIPHTTKIEVEVENLDQLQEALQCNVDIIMLDNMSIEMMKEAVLITKSRAILEASGNMSLERVHEVAATGVDIISVGALTHSVKALDISLKF